MTDSKASDAAKPAETGTQAGYSRRALLRGATLAAPAVLTLNSNTAVGWAIASGTIGTRAATGGTGSAICLDKTTVGSEIKPGVFAIDASGGDVVNVPSTLYYRQRQDNWTGTKTPLKPEEVCTRGGYIEYSTTGTTGSGWTKLRAPVNPNRYPLVSSTAVASFGSTIYQRDIREL